MKTTLANSVSGHTAQTCLGETPNAHNAYCASSKPENGIKPDNLAEVHQGAGVSNILTAEDCNTCPARHKCEDWNFSTKVRIRVGNSNCLTLREGLK